VIRSFADRDTERLWQGESVRRIPGNVQDRALIKLRLLNAATRLDDLRMPPGNRLEPLKGNRAGQWSIRINQQWRVCFVWRESWSDHVEIVDYH